MFISPRERGCGHDYVIRFIIFEGGGGGKDELREYESIFLKLHEFVLKPKDDVLDLQLAIVHFLETVLVL